MNVKRIVALGLALALSLLASAGVVMAEGKQPPAGKVNINTATAQQLETLPGVGAKLAARIVEYRQKSGGFKTEAEERKFWETHDSTDYVDWSKAVRVRFPNLKPSTTAISIRLPLGLLEQIKIAANKRDVPYQSLIKMWLAEKVG